MCEIQSKQLEELEHSLKVHFGRIVKDRRKKLDLNQEEYAHRCGLHKDTISRIESSKTMSSLLTFFLIAHETKEDAIPLFYPLLLRDVSRNVSGGKAEGCCGEKRVL